MINDPGRQLFHDQIQTHGFLFLNDYLDNIRAGPPSRLVKTPGRKKATSKRPVVATSALKTVTVSLEDDNDASSKENLVPVNSFHRALLQAKEKSPPSHKTPSPPQSRVEVSLQVKEKSPPPQKAPPGSHVEQAKENSPSPLESHAYDRSHEASSRAKERPPTPQQSHVYEAPVVSNVMVQNPPVPVVASVRSPSPPIAAISDDLVVEKLAVEEPQLLTVIPAEQNDLSVIAEDDETDRSRASLQGGSLSGPVAQPPDAGRETIPSPVSLSLQPSPRSLRILFLLPRPPLAARRRQRVHTYLLHPKLLQIFAL
ncbi:Inner centromere protein-related protein pic1 [Mycena venus]|uniref:Inner centromere protein-related protein pic1 n=1 Tax=Mycena venus TaxID=2733690 RepID=A0A8H6XUL3_9AGAR|nr:Inner centromere protein-related protein pic1 [Mycena venus]